MRAYFQKASLADLRAASAVTGDGQVLLDSGVVFFDGPTAVALARAHTRPPLRASTGLGVSAGDTALRTELFSDVLLAAQGGMGRGRGPYLADGGVADGSALCAAREALWEALHATALHMAAPRGAEFAHVGTTEELRHLLVRSRPRPYPTHCPDPLSMPASSAPLATALGRPAPRGRHMPRAHRPR